MQLTDIWHDYLQRLVEQRTRDATYRVGIGPAELDEEEKKYERMGKFKWCRYFLVKATKISSFKFSTNILERSTIFDHVCGIVIYFP